MCKVIEDMLGEEWEEGFQEGYQESLKIATLELLKDGKLTHEKIAYITKLSLDEIKELQAELCA